MLMVSVYFFPDISIAIKLPLMSFHSDVAMWRYAPGIQKEESIFTKRISKYFKCYAFNYPPLPFHITDFKSKGFFFRNFAFTNHFWNSIDTNLHTTFRQYNPLFC